MAVSLPSNEVSDLCLGKPALKSLSISATVGDALSALKRCSEICLSVWSCDHRSADKKKIGDCRCVGKVCMVDVICYLCREENLTDPASALKSPVSVLLPKAPGIVRHVEPHLSLLDALDLILDGAQNLIVPIETYYNGRKKLLKNQSILGTSHSNGREFCWLTQEDFVRFLLNSIGLFSPLPALSIDSLNIIRTDVLAVPYHDPAALSVDAIALALSQQTSVAVVTSDGKIIGEISPFTLAACDETIAAAIATLSAGDLMAYIDCGGPPEDLIRTVKARLAERDMEGMLELLNEFSSSSSSSSSDEESSFASSPSTVRYRPGSYSARMVRRAEAIVCHPGSSLVAVMIQALAHRVNYVWVIEDDYSLVGIVTFSDVLNVFREHLQPFQ
ncbi:CBS domain-containing protein CBSX5-like [Magnolia sinica]|uniref:CBS domain-containing protein CBSX5-like n=1 Tax=Magnolia sinica TaxID=86752 RepID=UPI002658E16F|nr:CBS domain-containing protein CBSX5-like [Magnolia sinica]